jgi:type IV secretory pathway VirB2 component (pilin)
MLHPLFSTLIQRPDLVMDHVSAYAALLNQEARVASAQVIRRSVAWVLAGVCGGVFVMFTGIALMLGFLHNQFHWILVVVPGVALLMTAVAIAKARQALPAEHFPELKAQIDSDTRALRMAA